MSQNLPSAAVVIGALRVNGKKSKLSKLLYTVTVILLDQEKGFYELKWIRCIIDILVSV